MIASQPCWPTILSGWSIVGSCALSKSSKGQQQFLRTDRRFWSSNRQGIGRGYTKAIYWAVSSWSEDEKRWKSAFRLTTSGQKFFGISPDAIDDNKIGKTASEVQDKIMSWSPGSLILELVTGNDEGVLV